jgi:Protein of unknown function (DUF1566)
MKSLTLFFAVLIAISTNIFAQGVGINSTGNDADASAMLDVSSTTKGFLPPRMTEAQKNAISTPATGLLVYQTDGTSGLYYYNGSAWETFVTGTHYLGESYGGGKVFYVDATGQHGLIAATSDQSTGIQWYNGNYRVTNSTGDGVEAGKMNTSIIIAMQTNDSTTGSFAALLCANLVVTSGGEAEYGDWYLPSKYELFLMYIHKAEIGVFTSGYYWSSTEVNGGGGASAWGMYFGDGTEYPSDKYYPGGVRAVRAF